MVLDERLGGQRWPVSPRSDESPNWLGKYSKRGVALIMFNPLRVALAVLTVAGAAHAQMTDDLEMSLASTAFEDNDIKVIGSTNCATQISENLALSGTFTNTNTFEGYSLRLTWTTGISPCPHSTFTSCLNEIDTVDDEQCGCIAEVNESETIANDDYSISELLESACEQDTGESEIRFYLEFRSSDGADTYSEPVVVTFDFDPPDAPTVAPTVVGVDGGLQITVPAGSSDVSRYRFCYFKTGEPECTSSSDNSKRIDGLDNGETYIVYYQLVDAAGNESPPSPEAEGSPVSSQDFAEFYSNIPGKAQGCSARPADDSTSLLWALLPLLALRRKRT